MVQWTNKDVVAFMVPHAEAYRAERGPVAKNEYATKHLVDEVHRLLGREYGDILSVSVVYFCQFSFLT